MSDTTSKHLSRAASTKFIANFIAVVLVIAGLFGGVARAQLSGTGAIAGTVQDPTGAVVPKATVTATNTSTNVSTVRTTTGAGDYNNQPVASSNRTPRQAIPIAAMGNHSASPAGPKARPARPAVATAPAPRPARRNQVHRYIVRNRYEPRAVPPCESPLDRW